MLKSDEMRTKWFQHSRHNPGSKRRPATSEWHTQEDGMSVLILNMTLDPEVGV